MLNFTLRAGECFLIGEDIKVVFLGGSSGNIRVMVDAPKYLDIVRGKVLEKYACVESYYPEPRYQKKKKKESMVQKG